MTSQSAKIPTSTAAARVRPAAVRPAATLAGRGNSLAMARAYLTLTKPGIIVELLVVAVPAMVLAANGWPGLQLIALILLGGVLTGGGANALNQWYDRDIDAKMGRTAGRPVPSGQIAPRHALWWGLLLSVVGGLLLLLKVNWLAGLLALAAGGFCVLAYTMWLKRRTVHNTVLGGIAGAAPPVVGWAAVTGGLDWPALVLFGIIFLWTPPHFWALASRYREDYAKASVPMLPVVAGQAETNRQILLYSLVLVASSLVLVPVAGMGLLYLVAALLLGVGFIGYAVRLWRTPGPSASMSLFFYSLPYLGLLFVAVGLDQLLRF